MFGFIKNLKTDKRKKKSQELQADTECGTKHNQSLTGDALRAQALANARKAREHIGEETVQKIAAAMAKKQNNPVERAKSKIAALPSDQVTDQLLALLDDK